MSSKPNSDPCKHGQAVIRIIVTVVLLALARWALGKDESDRWFELILRTSQLLVSKDRHEQ